MVTRMVVESEDNVFANTHRIEYIQTMTEALVEVSDDKLDNAKLTRVIREIYDQMTELESILWKLSEE